MGNFASWLDLTSLWQEKRETGCLLKDSGIACSKPFSVCNGRVRTVTAAHVTGSMTHEPVVSFICDRVARSPSDGLHQRQLPTENLHQLVMCGAMASSCGK